MIRYQSNRLLKKYLSLLITLIYVYCKEQNKIRPNALRLEHLRFTSITGNLFRKNVNYKESYIFKTIRLLKKECFWSEKLSRNF